MTAATQSRRLAVSPYARRLARERGYALATLRGSGPGGRILAADVLGFVPLPPPESRPAGAPASPPRIAAFAASIALGALHALLAAFEATGNPFELDDILLRAAGRAFAETPDITTVADAPVAFELDGRQAVFSALGRTNATVLRKERLEALRDGRDEAAKPAVLSLRLLTASDIRPVMMPLLPDRAMRLIVSADAASAECLLAFDAGVVEEGLAAAWLACVKSAIENPLRLFA